MDGLEMMARIGVWLIGKMEQQSQVHLGLHFMMPIIELWANCMEARPIVPIM